MVQVDPEDITNVAPEFESVDPDVIEFWIESARDYVAESRWGTKAKRGIMFMAMHLMSRNGLGDNASIGGVGAVVSETVGGISTTYDVASSSSADGSALGLTSYGEMFLMLRKTIVGTPLVT